MSQPILPTDQWERVRDTAVACGSIKRAAEQHSVSYVAARQRAKRERWPVATRLNTAIVKAKQAATRSIEAATGHVTRVTSASDALVNILAEDEHETKLSLSRSARQLAVQGETASLTRRAMSMTLLRQPRSCTAGKIVKTPAFSTCAY